MSILFPTDLRNGLYTRLSFGLICALLLVFLLPQPATAAGNVTGRRAALVVGNSTYNHLSPLPNAASDADRIKGVLERANFEVTLGKDLDKRHLEETVLGFLRSLNDGDVALFYYSGHAIQVAGQNYMLPVDATLASSYDLEVEAYSLTSLLDYMRAASSMQIAILDASRDTVSKSDFFYVGQTKVAVDKKKGLAAIKPSEGTLIVYSTAPDEVAPDEPDDAGAFTGTFADNMLKPNVEVRKLIDEIRSNVVERTEGRQTPWDASSLTSSFFFVTRQNLLIIEDLREVRMAPGDKEVALHISPPISSGDTALTVSFTALPKAGTLWLDGDEVGAETVVEAARVSDIVYRPASSDFAEDRVTYAVKTDGGRTANGAVRISVDAAAGTKKPIKPTLAIAKGAEEPAGPAKPILVAMASEVGTGFSDLPREAIRSSDAPKGWLRLENRDPNTQVALGNDIISEGDLIKAEDISRLRIRPSLRIVAADEEIVVAATKPAAAPAVVAKKEEPVPEVAAAEPVEPAVQKVEEPVVAAAEPVAPAVPKAEEPVVGAAEPVAPAVQKADEPVVAAAEPTPEKKDAAAVADAEAGSQKSVPMKGEIVLEKSTKPIVLEPATQAVAEPAPKPVVQAALVEKPSKPQAAPKKPDVLKVTLVPAVKTATPAPITIEVAVSVNDCDTLAAEPLDVQAVAKGILPNEIDVPRALEAWKSAVSEHPDIARFKYQYARALYASGDFKAALAELNAANDAGHVRAGYLLGRLYQLGAAVERDPAKAIPLYEAGKGDDPYAQYSLGSAYISDAARIPTSIAASSCSRARQSRDTPMQ